MMSHARSPLIFIVNAFHTLFHLFFGELGKTETLLLSSERRGASSSHIYRIVSSTIDDL
jgi:hypothetical protein